MYIRASPLAELPEALFLVLFAAADGYRLNRRLCLLERLNRRAPDSVALTCGIAALLRQFHPCYARVSPPGTLCQPGTSRRMCIYCLCCP